MSTRIGFCLLLLAAACGKSEPAAPAAAPQPAKEAAPLAQAPAAAKPSPQEIFTTRCVPCHGASGTGDGPAAAALNPKPRNYTESDWHHCVTDDQQKTTLPHRAAAVGKSAAMPSHPDLESNPEQLDGLVKMIRAFAAK